ncbi:hypothetical protein F383_28953 [Gossypium arboreum]|uniref:Uncharacterized protein n=1 Tax=Gossypium arboreum TaxID=29729 RepID=A0A0B0MZI6_GOSAR|nr:hypothetical protein F383_28953 [Gossypium arboreum]
MQICLMRYYLHLVTKVDNKCMRNDRNCDPFFIFNKLKAFH